MVFPELNVKQGRQNSDTTKLLKQAETCSGHGTSWEPALPTQSLLSSTSDNKNQDWWTKVKAKDSPCPKEFIV